MAQRSGLPILIAIVILAKYGSVSAHEGHDHSMMSTAPAPSSSLSYLNPLEAVLVTPSLSYLQYAILISGLEGSFVSPNTSYTILAPSNFAFQRQSQDFLTSQRLAGVLAGHIIPTALLASNLSNGMTIPTLWGLSLNVTISGSNVSFNGGSNSATVVTPNIRAGKNIIHIVDNLLDRRSNPALSNAQSQATLSKINYSTMLQKPALSPGQTAHDDITHSMPPTASANVNSVAG